MFLVSLTYETYTHEDIEVGEASDSGYEYQDQAMTLREVVRTLDSGGPWEADGVPFTLYPGDTLLRFYAHASSDAGTRRELETGERTNRAIHIRGTARATKRLSGYLRTQGYYR